MTGVPHEEKSFNEDSLSLFGDIDRPCEMIGEFFSKCCYISHFHPSTVPSLCDSEVTNSCLQWGNLRNLAVASRDLGSELVLNVLSLPLGEISVPVPPKYRSVSLHSFYCSTYLHAVQRALASHEHAWQVSNGRPRFVPNLTMSNDLIWGTAALQHAVSWTHIDAEEFNTMISIETGSKYWVVGWP